MAEYAGYVPTTPIDFGAISSDFLSKKASIAQMKREQDLAEYKLQKEELLERQKLQRENYKLERESDKEFKNDLIGLESASALPNQSDNTYFYKGLDNSKKRLVELNTMLKNGEITQSDYNMIYSNIKSQWKQVSEVTKGYSQNFQKLLETLPQQTALGAWKIGKLGNAAQLGDKELDTLPDGTLVQYTIDPTTGEKVKGDTLTNLSLLNNPSVWSDIQKKSYPELFSDAEKAIGNYTVENGAITTTDKTKRPKFEAYVSTLISGIIPDDESKARLLSSMNGYTFYSNEQERQQNVTMKLQNLKLTGDELAKAKKEAEDNQIQMVLNSKGTYDVKLTPEQSAKAEAITRENILGRIEFKQTKDEPKPTKIVVNPGGKITSDVRARRLTLKSAKNTWNRLTSGNKTERDEAIRDLTGLFSDPDFPIIAEPLYNPNRTIKGLRIHEKEDDGSAGRTISEIKSIKDVFKAYTPRDKKGSEITDYEAAVDEERLFDDY